MLKKKPELDGRRKLTLIASENRNGTAAIVETSDQSKERLEIRSSNVVGFGFAVYRVALTTKPHLLRWSFSFHCSASQPARRRLIVHCSTDPTIHTIRTIAKPVESLWVSTMCRREAIFLADR